MDQAWHRTSIFIMAALLASPAPNMDRFETKGRCSFGLQKTELGGGFKYFLFSPLFGEMTQFDWYFSNRLKPPTREPQSIWNPWISPKDAPVDLADLQMVSPWLLRGVPGRVTSPMGKGETNKCSKKCWKGKWFKQSSGDLKVDTWLVRFVYKNNIDKDQELQLPTLLMEDNFSNFSLRVMVDMSTR